MTIQPIRSEQDHKVAIARISALMSAKRGTPEGDELDILATLVDAYETRVFPIEAPNPIAAIEFRMEQQGLTRKDLESIIGTRARVSEIMTGKRPLTLAMIRRLRADLGISADLLIQSHGPTQSSRRPSKLNRVPDVSRRKLPRKSATGKISRKAVS